MMNPRSVRTTKGQATIEYILVLVVVVGIIAGLILRFNQAIKGYANELFTGYIVCLLETGELPLIGGEPGAGLADECRPPTIAPPSAADLAGTGGAGGAGGKSSTNPGGGRDADGKRRGGGAGAKKDRPAEGQTPSSKTADGAGGRGARGGGSSFDVSRGRPKSTSSQENPKTVGAAGSGNDGGKLTPLSLMFPPRQVAGKHGIVVSTFTLSEEMQRDEAAKKASKTPLGKKKGQGGRETRTSLEVVAKKSGLATDSGTEFSIGSLLRYIILIGLLILLVIFIGGQVMSAVKGFDKAD